MTARHQLKRSAAECQRIDTVMDTEAAVLIGQQQLDIAGIDAGFGIGR